MLHCLEPDVMVQITSTVEGINLTAGTNFSLNCNVDGAINLRPQLSYEWIHFDGMDYMTVGTNSSRLTFPSLKLSDAGEYMCTVNISSSLLNSDLTKMSMLPHPVRVYSKYWAWLSIR